MQTDTKMRGATLQTLRKCCIPKLTQQELAAVLGMAQSNISAIEKSGSMSVDTLCAAAAVLACRLPMTQKQIIVAIALGDLEAE
jgi:transcriptional regulator with XRE-family HTH domain